MTSVNRALGLIALMLVSASAAAQTHPLADAPDRPDLGSVTGSTYSNKYFGFTRIGQEEIFGPVTSVIPTSSLDEAIEIANGVRYGMVLSPRDFSGT